MKEIYLTKHAIKRLQDRKISFEEVRETIFQSKWNDAKHSRFYATKVFQFDQEQKGSKYEYKEVTVFFTEESDKIIAITAIAKYF